MTAIARSYPVLKRVTEQFDYGTVSVPTASDLQAQAKLIKSLIAKTTADLIEAGRNLIAAKAHLEHGKFCQWVEAEVGIFKRTAQSYMAIARLAEKTKSATVALLPPTTVHRLAAPSAPVEVIDHVIAQANGGVIVPDSEVVEMLREARLRHLGKQKERAARRKAARKASRSNLMIEDANGKFRPATKEEEAAFGDIANRVFSNPDMATPCNFAAALANPINTAWREGSEFHRANFVRLYLDDILKVEEQVKLSDQQTNQPNDDDLDIPASPRLHSPGPTP